MGAPVGDFEYHMNPFTKFCAMYMFEEPQASLVKNCRLVPMVAPFLVVNQWNKHILDVLQVY